jgi:hypothetical protein
MPTVPATGKNVKLLPAISACLIIGKPEFPTPAFRNPQRRNKPLPTYDVSRPHDLFGLLFILLFILGHHAFAIPLLNEEKNKDGKRPPWALPP